MPDRDAGAGQELYSYDHLGAVDPFVPLVVFIERWVLVQTTHPGGGADAAIDQAAERLRVDRPLVESTPFLLFGSVEQVVDELESRRERLGISHVVVRDAEGFAPVVAALAGR